MTEITIDLDRKHRLIHSAPHWALLRRTPDGGYDTLDTWEGPRRSVFGRLVQYDIHPSRDAEQRLGTIPEKREFRPDDPPPA